MPDENLPETIGASSAPDEATAIGNRRRTVGYVLGGGTIIALGALGWWSLRELHTIPVPETWIAEKFAFAIIGGHAVITIALIYFLYQVLRIAERLAIPYWWVDKDPSPVRTMLGVRDPLSAMTKLAREFVGATKALATKK